jgi:hypothetical protein
VLQPDGERYNACAPMSVDQVQQLARQHYPPYIARLDRWITHYQNRLAYERALFADDGGTVADRTKPEKGGAVRCWASPDFGRGWAYFQRVNQVSVTIHDKPSYGDRLLRVVVPFDKLDAVMTADQVTAARSRPPAGNRPGRGFLSPRRPARACRSRSGGIHAAACHPGSGSRPGGDRRHA